jgi:hypothetical protein
MSAMLYLRGKDCSRCVDVVWKCRVFGYGRLNVLILSNRFVHISEQGSRVSPGKHRETVGIGFHFEALPVGKQFETVGRTITETDIVGSVNDPA